LEVAFGYTGRVSFAIENFGCRAARADGEALAEGLAAAGHAEASLAEAELVVVNTCSVTAEADRSARAMIRRARRLNPKAKIVVTGCYAQRAPEEIAAMDGVSAVVGNSHKGEAPAILLSLLGQKAPQRGFVALGEIGAASSASAEEPKKIWVDEAFAHSFLAGAQVTVGQQTRPNLKIQEGCQNNCSFCVIPRTRGPLRSLAAEEVLAQVAGFVATGGREIVFSGINLGRYFAQAQAGETHKPGLNLEALVRRVLAETELQRLRLSSIEPMDWSAGMVALLRQFAYSEGLGSNPEARLARHVHLPLQSGSDNILRRMHRRYRPWHFEQKVAEIVAAAGPGLCLGTDLMVGFPGESEAEFEESYSLVERLPFAYVHLFPFSARPETEAWEWQRQCGVEPKTVKAKMERMRQLAERKSVAFRRQFIGAELEALALHSDAEVTARNCSEALSENFLPIEVCGQFTANTPLRVRIEWVSDEGKLTGSAVGQG